MDADVDGITTVGQAGGIMGAVPMGLWELSRAAWRDAFEAMRRNASLFTLAVIAMLIIGVVYNSLVAAPQLAAIRIDGPKALGNLRFLPWTLVMTALQVVVMAPCAVAVHRAILAREPAASIDERAVRRWGNFAVWLFAVDMMMLVPSLLVQVGAGGGYHGGAAILGALVGFVALIAALIVSVRLTLMFPAAAIDIAAPYRQSWQLTRGHWWGIFGTLVFNTIGIVLIAIIPLGLARLVSGSPASALGAMLQALLHILSTAVIAGVASWLYRSYGGVADTAGSPWAPAREMFRSV